MHCEVLFLLIVAITEGKSYHSPPEVNQNQLGCKSEPRC